MGENLVPDSEGHGSGSASALDEGSDKAACCSEERQTDVTAAQETLSKRQLKRLKKRQLFLARLPEKRAKEKQKSKERRKAAILNNLPVGPTRKQLKNAKMSASVCKVHVALDFSFDGLMTPKDIAKCVNQVQRCYCINRRVPNPIQFHVVNLNGKSREEMSKLTGYVNWDVNFHHEEYLKLFPKEKLVYLSSESDNILERFDDDSVYIIGALVDHNLHKGHCLNVAVQQGIQHARLPISEYMDMKSRKVLAINHVFEIIVKVCNGADWKKAFLDTLPLRKNAVAKADDSDEQPV